MLRRPDPAEGHGSGLDGTHSTSLTGGRPWRSSGGGESRKKPSHELLVTGVGMCGSAAVWFEEVAGVEGFLVEWMGWALPPASGMGTAAGKDAGRGA